MHRLMLLPILLAASAGAAPSQLMLAGGQGNPDEAKIAHALNGYSPGPSRDCLPRDSSHYHTTGVGETLLYSANRQEIFRNDTTGCSGVEHGDILITQNYSTQLCRGQIATTIDRLSSVPTGSCTLGAFVPYRKAK